WNLWPRGNPARIARFPQHARLDSMARDGCDHNRLLVHRVDSTASEASGVLVLPGQQRVMDRLGSACPRLCTHRSAVLSRGHEHSRRAQSASDSSQCRELSWMNAVERRMDAFVEMRNIFPNTSEVCSYGKGKEGRKADTRQTVCRAPTSRKAARCNR